MGVSGGLFLRRGMAARVSFRFFLLSRRLGLRRLASVGRIRPLGPFFAPLEAPFAGRVLLFPFRPRARSWALRERPAPFCPAEPDICLPCRGNWMLLSARRGCS